MLSSPVVRILALAAVLAPLGGCQAFFGDDQDNSIGSQRLAATAPVASKQRLDDDGYPLLGAFPGTAAPQLTDAEVSRDSGRFNGVASERAATPAANDYAARLARADAVRRRQLADVNAALAKKPTPAKSTGSKGSSGPTPEEVLKQIESGT